MDGAGAAEHVCRKGMLKFAFNCDCGEEEPIWKVRDLEAHFKECLLV
jgi:hypothetical protein